MKSILIKDTTRAERIRIVNQALTGTSKNNTLPQTCTSENPVKQGFLKNMDGENRFF